MRLSITSKFNLVFLAIFTVGFATAGAIANALLQANAKEEVLGNARILMESAMVVRAYTQQQIVPLLQTQLKYKFLPQSVPSFAATENLTQLRQKFIDYAYKEAVLNPTNPRDRATDWEVDVVQKLRDQPDNPEFVGERDTPTGRSLYIAHPIQIKQEACLVCHSTVDQAPKTLVDAYGPNNGFGWRLHDVVGAQIVSVPMLVAYQRAERILYNFMAALLGVFVFVFIALNVMLRYIVTSRIRRLSGLADQVSMGNMDVEQFPVSGSDEIGVLAASFNRMRTSLVGALKMLDA